MRDYEELILVISFVLLLSLGGMVTAGTVVWDSGGTSDINWTNPYNWSTNSLPTSIDLALIGDWGSVSAGPALVNSDVTPGSITVGRRGSGSPAYLDITGGSITQTNNIIIGQNADGVGIVTMSGGTWVATAGAMVVGDSGNGTLDMTGGSISLFWQLYVGHNTGAVGHVNLHGGIIDARSLGLGHNGGSGTMDITEGLLKMKWDHTAAINGYVSEGLITAYGGIGTVVVEYDTITEYTTVSAPPIDPALAWNPEPIDGYADPLDDGKVVLSWSPGQGADSHDVYFGTDFNDVNDATPSSSEYEGNLPLDSNSYNLSGLERMTYYWRIDELDGATVHKGDIWSFTKTIHKPTIYHLNLTSIDNFTMEEQYDIKHVAACIQGLVNRDFPRVYLSFPLEIWGNNDDLLWLNRIREDGALCYGWKVSEIASVEALLDEFAEYVSGVVLYDPDPDTGVISTSLVATTVAGVEGGVAVRKDTAPDSMYNYLVNDLSGPQLPVLVDLAGKFTGSGTIWDTSTPSTGSAKCDAYIWAKEKYIDTGRCNPTVLMYKMDLWGLGLGHSYPWQLGDLDYGIRNKGFCFELSPYGDQIPNDDPSQPMGTDRDTFKQILHACNLQTGQAEMIMSCGFPNWPVKYSDSVGGLYDGGHLEGTMVMLLSAYNAYMSADAGNFCNASFYTGLLPGFKSRRYVQNPAATYDDMVSRGLIDGGGNVVPGNYIMVAHGDYDGAMGILYRLAGQRYDDPVRGQRYMNWAVNANEIERVAVAIDYLYRNKSTKDFFVAGDSGCGYVYPHKFHGGRTPSGYPDCIDIWQEHNSKYHRLMDYSITGWIHSGYLGDKLSLTDCFTYAPFSGDGFVLNDDTPVVLSEGLANNAPYIICDAPWVATLEPCDVINYSSGVHFATYHLPFWYPNEMKNFEDEVIALGNNHRFLDAYTFFYLFRYHIGGNNNYRATWVSDTIPRIMTAEQSYPVTVTVRNDGWDTWSDADCYRLGYAIVPQGGVPGFSDYDTNGRFTIAGTVAPGQSYTFNVDIVAPSTSGDYDIYYDMVRDGVTWFRDKNNIEWKKEIIVAADEADVDTDSDGCPDVAEESLGLLYWHPDDRFAADIFCDGVVDTTDITILSEHWLEQGENLPGDINDDLKVNFLDFAIIASYF